MLIMQKRNEKNRTVLVLTITIILLVLLSYLPANFNLFGYEVKPVDLFMDIKPDSLLDYSYQNENPNLLLNNNYINPSLVNKSGKKLPYYSSISFDLLYNFYSSLNERWAKVNDNLLDGPNIRDIPLSGNVAQMSYFYNALKNSKNQKIRVAHYGDSGNEGDGVTADIRYALQNRFGGNGVGMLAITSQDIMFRSTTKHTFSDNWSTYSVVFGNSQNLPLGMNGFVSVPNGSAWVKYQATGALPDTKTFKTVRIFYTNAKSSSIGYSFNDGPMQTAALTPGSDLKEITLNGPENSTSFKMTTNMANQAQFFGVSLEDGNGVYVDNFPWRGNSGISFRNLSPNILQGFDKLCNYKLIILEFGANIVSPIAKNYNWYENEMINNINNLKKIFPQTSFLLLGMGDKGYKRGSKFVTDPGIPPLIQAQKNIVEKTGIAFWDKFDAMGGVNSMENWVYANPPLALMDYSHLTSQGESKMGQLIAKIILDGYK